MPPRSSDAAFGKVPHGLHAAIRTGVCVVQRETEILRRNFDVGEVGEVAEALSTFVPGSFHSSSWFVNEAVQFLGSHVFPRQRRRPNVQILGLHVWRVHDFAGLAFCALSGTKLPSGIL